MSVYRMTPAEWARKQAANRTAHRRPATERVRLVLPMPPTVNHSSGPTAGGGRYLTPEHKAFRDEVTLRVVAAGSPRFADDARLTLDITLVPADRRKWDLDNRIKSLQDALQVSGVYADDSQIDELRIVRHDVVIPGEASAVVTISERSFA